MSGLIRLMSEWWDLDRAKIGRIAADCGRQSFAAQWELGQVICQAVALGQFCSGCQSMDALQRRVTAGREGVGGAFDRWEWWKRFVKRQLARQAEEG